MVQANEVLTLILGVVGLVVVWHLLRSLPRNSRLLLGGGYLVMLGSSLFTVLEGFWLPDFFNLLEHLGYVLAGVLFALACWRLPRDLSERPPESGG